MTRSIAMAGKGGTGKTTIASLIIRYLLNHQSEPVLAVDADPAANLGFGLGINKNITVGTILAEFNRNKITIPSGLSKEAFLNLKLNEAIAESRGIDLITMGRGEGAGCYCFPNNVLKNFISKLMPNYKYLVLDNEAGLEHLSRGMTDKIDHLILASNHSIKGIRTLDTIRHLIAELNLNIKRIWIVINEAPESLDPLVSAEMTKLNMTPDFLIPQDKYVVEYDWKQCSLLNMAGDSKAVQAVDSMMDKISSFHTSEVRDGG